jgi:hypothetical protein
MRLKQDSPGLEDVLGNLQEMGNRKVMRRVVMWLRGPRWIPTEVQLEAMRAYTRGQARNLRTGVSRAENSLSGEISVAWIASSPA